MTLLSHVDPDVLGDCYKAHILYQVVKLLVGQPHPTGGGGEHHGQ